MASTTFGTPIATYSFTSSSGMVANVQSWLNSPATNFGWLIKTDNEGVVSAREFGSAESAPADRPTLTVTYTVPEPGIAGLLGVGLLLGTMRSRRKHAARN